MTASIGRMNLVLHGVEDLHIACGDTLDAPHFAHQDRLTTCDLVLANPPYSIKRRNRDAWQSDVWGRNTLGTPPQGRADYAFFCSTGSGTTGRRAAGSSGSRWMRWWRRWMAYCARIIHQIGEQ